jgi:cytidine deaminase
MTKLITARLQKLLERARSASRRAYAPYSGFRVGAALATRDGRVFTGCNVENASYGLTVCAERSAVLAAIAAGHRRFRAIAVVGGTGKPAHPCGACLQVLAEFCDPGLEVVIAPLRRKGAPVRMKLGDLLPRSFSLP